MRSKEHFDASKHPTDKKVNLEVNCLNSDSRRTLIPPASRELSKWSLQNETLFGPSGLNLDYTSLLNESI